LSYNNGSKVYDLKQSYTNVAYDAEDTDLYVDVYEYRPSGILSLVTLPAYVNSTLEGNPHLTLHVPEGTEVYVTYADQLAINP
jgi:hypothetical protein